MKDAIGWLGNAINFFIFMLLFIKTSPQCFNTQDQLIALGGIIVSLIAQALSSLGERTNT